MRVRVDSGCNYPFAFESEIGGLVAQATVTDATDGRPRGDIPLENFGLTTGSRIAILSPFCQPSGGIASGKIA
jgi:hypothetical protein